MANLYEPHWDVSQAEPPSTWQRARLGRQAGARQLGASLFELPPGGATFPLHVHHANEELLVVVAGRPTLTTLEAELVLEPGEVVACRAGREGAHRLDNRTGEAARILIVSTMLAPEINEFPENGEGWARSYVPGTDPGPGDVEFPRADPTVRALTSGARVGTARALRWLQGGGHWSRLVSRCW